MLHDKRGKLWEYEDVSVLNIPLAVSIDNKHNVYVTSYIPHSVVVVGPDGRQGRQLINSDDGLKYSTGIYFDKSKNSLLVTNYQGPTFLYEMC